MLSQSGFFHLRNGNSNPTLSSGVHHLGRGGIQWYTEDQCHSEYTQLNGGIIPLACELWATSKPLPRARQPQMGPPWREAQPGFSGDLCVSGLSCLSFYLHSRTLIRAPPCCSLRGSLEVHTEVPGDLWTLPVLLALVLAYARSLSVMCCTPPWWPFPTSVMGENIKALLKTN